MLTAFWGSIAAMFAGIGATIVNTVYPRGVSGFGGPVTVAADRIPKPGDSPVKNIEGRFWLVNVAAGEGLAVGDTTPTAGGLVALWTKCPHLGCSVPWNDTARRPNDDRTGFFLCPCHGSTYTRAGVRVFGPTPRSMDTMAIDVTDSGIVVQTGKRTKGTPDNPARAVPWQGAG
jgi:cytochrome b6-f complex iron-sulfur subunit